MMDLNAKMQELISNVGDGDIKSSRRNKPLIDEIATFCRETGIYKKQPEKAENFGDDMDAVGCYLHLVERVAHAPTYLHTRMTVILIMPIIATKLEEVNQWILQ